MVQETGEIWALTAMFLEVPLLLPPPFPIALMLPLELIFVNTLWLTDNYLHRYNQYLLVHLFVTTTHCRRHVLITVSLFLKIWKFISKDIRSLRSQKYIFLFFR